MENYPRSLLEFQEQFATDETCYQYLASLRWPDGFVCPKCGHTKAWQTSRQLYVCGRCRVQTSATAGTIFHRTRKPLRLWFHAIWQITSQKYGANAIGMQRVLGLGSYQTAWEWLHRLRRAMVRPGRGNLSGTIEVDETYIGGERPGKRGRGADNKALVMVAVEDKGRPGQGFGRIRLRRVNDASSASLTPFVQSNVVPGSTVRTDGWSGYSHLADHGYDHIKVRASGKVGHKELPLVHRIASLVKRWLLSTYQGAVQPTHLDYYLDEYTFRFNRRTSASRGKLFYRLVQQAAMVDPVHGDDLTADQDQLCEPLLDYENYYTCDDIKF